MTSVAPQGWVRPVKMNTNEIDKADAMAAACAPFVEQAFLRSVRKLLQRLKPCAQMRPPRRCGTRLVPIDGDQDLSDKLAGGDQPIPGRPLCLPRKSQAGEL